MSVMMTGVRVSFPAIQHPSSIHNQGIHDESTRLLPLPKSTQLKVLSVSVFPQFMHRET